MQTKKKKASPVKKKLAKKSKADKKSDKDVKFPIVGIGASAGGLETLNAFLFLHAVRQRRGICDYPASEP